MLLITWRAVTCIIKVSTFLFMTILIKSLLLISSTYFVDVRASMVVSNV